ncbi:MAG: peroxiredoxin [Piscirickettsiaceae bacterium]|nr:MAG: peroxiredoxin [Piscirickettsiaceae bacterium]PCI70899.1 MAG: peroxiredoxin [Piscirickettsiaceae bacterium]
MSTIQLNQAVPEFTCATTNNEAMPLSSLKGKNIVIYFYPKDNTPGCTQEGQDFRDNYAAFQAANTEIFGVSRDSIRVHNGFKAKYDFPFELISDPDESLCKLFDVIKLKKLYGKEYMGIERSTFLINTDSMLVQEWRKVKVKEHVSAVLTAAETL